MKDRSKLREDFGLLDCVDAEIGFKI